MTGSRLYGWLLRCYPARVRRRYGTELLDVAGSFIEDGRRRRGWRGSMGAWVVLVADVIRTLPVEWLEEVRFAWRGPGPGRGGRADAKSSSDDLHGLSPLGPGEPHWRRRRLVVESLVTEFRHGLRRLWRSPGFTAAAVLTLALGIGANTAVFSVVNAVLLRPLPYPDADRLVVLSETRADDQISVAYLDLVDWRERNRTVDGPAGYVSRSFTVTGDGPAERLRGVLVTADLFGVLGVEPAIGRGFVPLEDTPSATRVVVIGHGLWQRRFGGDPGVLGRTVRLNGEPFEVIGVMPPGFEFPAGLVYSEAEVWAPIGLQVGAMTERGDHPGIYAVARLRDGIAFGAAQADLSGIAAQLEAEHPESNEQVGVRMRTAMDQLVGSVRPALLALLGAVGLILLIVCANVANLLVVRSTSRRREMGVRAALGASRGGLLAPALMESVILAVAGGTFGVLLARWLTGAGGALLGGLPRITGIQLDGRVLTFSAAAITLTVLLFGMAPLVQALGSRSSTWLHSRGEGRGATRLRAMLVIGEIALALVVLLGAGLLVRSFAELQATDPGIDPDGALTFYIRLPEAEYGEGEPVRTFYGQLQDRLNALRGVTATGGVAPLPFSGSGSQSTFVAVDRPEMEPHRSDVAVVMPGYFRSLGIELMRGRVFDETDGPSSQAVVVIDESLARLLWPGSDPIGERVSGWGLQDAEVVGVVRHVMNYGVASASREQVYMPHSQRSYNAMWVTLRTSAEADFESLIPSIREIVAELDAAVPVDNVMSMPELVADRISTPRLTAALGGGFALLAIVLCAIGIYGVVAYSVTQRTREIGTRVALGAVSADVTAMVVRQGAMLAGAGVAIGIPVSLAATRLISSQIHGISPADPATFIILPLALLGVVLSAAWLPARRAARISPLEALRDD